MEVHGGSWSWEEKRTKSTLFPYLHAGYLAGVKASVCRGAVRDKRGRSRVSSAWCGVKVSERKERARNGWRMVSVRGCVVFVYS